MHIIGLRNKLGDFMVLISIIGLIMSIWGTLKLIDANKLLLETLSTNFKSIELSLTTLTHAVNEEPNNVDELGNPVTDIYIFQNWDKHYPRIYAQSVDKNNKGIRWLIAGFAVQIVPLVVQQSIPFVELCIRNIF